MAVSDYDQDNNGQGQGPTVDKQKGQLLQSRWKDLSAKQQAKFGSKADYSNQRGDYRRAQEQGANTSYNSRMAGQKMNDLKDKREELREDKDGNAEQLQKINQRINKQEDRVYGGELENFDASAAGAGSSKGTNRISKQDIRGLIDAGHSAKDVQKYMEGYEGKFSGKAQNLLNKYVGEMTETPTPTPEPGPTPSPDSSDPPGNDNEPPGTPEPDATNPPAPTPAPTPAPSPSAGDGDDNEQTPDTLGGGGMENSNSGNASEGGVINQGSGDAVGGNNTQTGTGNMVGNDNVNTGGNEQNTEVRYGNDTATVNGNNNTVDQSERYYGGNQNNMSIVYGEGSSPMNTAAVSDLTTLGLGKADDSPAAQAKFVNMYQDLNKQAQKQYSNVGTSTANQYIQNAADTNPIDYVALNDSISDSILNHYDKATKQEAFYMGDKYNYRPPTYEMPEPLDPVTNNVDNATENAEDGMDDDD